MSTRANIKVVDEQHELWLYHHSDGYPEGVGSILVELLGKYNKEKWEINELIDFICKSDNDFERTTGVHGDIEYLYVIDIVEKSLKCFERDYRIRDFNKAFDKEVDIPYNIFSFGAYNIFDEICDNNGNFVEEIKINDLGYLGLFDNNYELLPKYKKQLKKYLDSHDNLKYNCDIVTLYHYVNIDNTEILSALLKK